MSKGVTCGGWSDPKPADGDISTLSKWMWKPSEADTNRKYNEFKAIEYRSQVVAGYNYVIKVKVGENDYVYLQIFLSPIENGTFGIRFMGAKGGYKQDDPLEPFNDFV